MLIIPYPRLYNSLYTFGEFVTHVWISRYPRLGICISYRKDDDKPCFIDLII